MKIFSPILKGTTTVSQGTTNLSGSFTGSLFGTAATASYADNFTVGGTLTAQTINVQIITSSIEFNTGSTRNGALSTNTHEFTGSVLMSGSLNVGGVSTFLNKLSINNPEGNYANGITIGGPGTGFMMYSTGTGSQNIISVLNASNYNYGVMGVVTGNGLIAGDVFGLGYASSPNTSFTSALNWTSTGNVGIGITSPSALLHVKSSSTYGTIIIDNTGTTGGGGYSARQNGSTRANFGVSGWIEGTTTSDAAVAAEGGIRFYTNGTADIRMQLTSSGFLKVSPNSNFSAGNQHELNTNVGGRNAMYNINSSADPYGNYIAFSAAAPNDLTHYYLYCDDTSNHKFVIYSNGSVYNRTGTYAAISDIKLKENIVDATPKLDDLLKVKVRNYNLIGDELKQIGVIAQELEEIFPNMVDNTVNKETGEITKGVKYSIFIPMLIKAIQELKSENDTLKEILQRNNIQ
jgi:hypothetical protein